MSPTIFCSSTCFICLIVLLFSTRVNLIHLAYLKNISHYNNYARRTVSSPFVCLFLFYTCSRSSPLSLSKTCFVSSLLSSIWLWHSAHASMTWLGSPSISGLLQYSLRLCRWANDRPLLYQHPSSLASQLTMPFFSNSLLSFLLVDSQNSVRFPISLVVVRKGGDMKHQLTTTNQPVKASSRIPLSQV